MIPLQMRHYYLAFSAKVTTFIPGFLSYGLIDPVHFYYIAI